VDEVTVNIDDAGLAGSFADDVGVPDLLVEGLGCVSGGHGCSLLFLGEFSKNVNAA
jgi:hypothetical protein